MIFQTILFNISLLILGFQLALSSTTSPPDLGGDSTSKPGSPKSPAQPTNTKPDSDHISIHQLSPRTRDELNAARNSHSPRKSAERLIQNHESNDFREPNLTRIKKERATQKKQGRPAKPGSKGYHL